MSEPLGAARGTPPVTHGLEKKANIKVGRAGWEAGVCPSVRVQRKTLGPPENFVGFRGTSGSNI